MRRNRHPKILSIFVWPFKLNKCHPNLFHHSQRNFPLFQSNPISQSYLRPRWFWENYFGNIILTNYPVSWTSESNYCQNFSVFKCQISSGSILISKWSRYDVIVHHRDQTYVSKFGYFQQIRIQGNFLRDWIRKVWTYEKWLCRDIEIMHFFGLSYIREIGYRLFYSLLKDQSWK